MNSAASLAAKRAIVGHLGSVGSIFRARSVPRAPPGEALRAGDDSVGGVGSRLKQLGRRQRGGDLDIRSTQNLAHGMLRDGRLQARVTGVAGTKRTEVDEGVEDGGSSTEI